MWGGDVKGFLFSVVVFLKQRTVAVVTFTTAIKDKVSARESLMNN